MSEACDTYSLGVLILVVTTGLPVYANHEHVRDVVGDLLDELKEQSGSPGVVPEELLLSSELVASSCDWSFPGGAKLLLELLGLGYRASHPRMARRPASSAVLEELSKLMPQLETRACLLCLEAPRTVVLEPCRHSVACEPCTVQLLATQPNAPCPMCRIPIVSSVPASRPVLNTFVTRLPDPVLPPVLPPALDEKKKTLRFEREEQQRQQHEQRQLNCYLVAVEHGIIIPHSTCCLSHCLTLLLLLRPRRRSMSL